MDVGRDTVISSPLDVDRSQIHPEGEARGLEQVIGQFLAYVLVPSLGRLIDQAEKKAIHGSSCLQIAEVGQLVVNRDVWKKEYIISSYMDKNLFLQTFIRFRIQTVENRPMLAVETDEAGLDQGMAEAIGGRGERIRDGRVHVRIVALVISFAHQFEAEYPHHVLT